MSINRRVKNGYGLACISGPTPSPGLQPIAMSPSLSLTAWCTSVYWPNKLCETELPERRTIETEKIGQRIYTAAFFFTDKDTCVQHVRSANCPDVWQLAEPSPKEFELQMSQAHMLLHVNMSKMEHELYSIKLCLFTSPPPVFKSSTVQQVKYFTPRAIFCQTL